MSALQKSYELAVYDRQWHPAFATREQLWADRL